MNEKKNKVGINFLFLIISLLIFAVAATGDRYVRIRLDNMTLDVNLVITLRFLFYFIAGTVFGLEKLFTEKKNDGHWKVNISRLLIIGVPSLFIGLLTFSYTFLSLLYPQPYVFACFIQMLFGYTIITSFYKSF